MLDHGIGAPETWTGNTRGPARRSNATTRGLATRSNAPPGSSCGTRKLARRRLPLVPGRCRISSQRSGRRWGTASWTERSTRRDHENQQTRTPWFDARAHRVRDDVFVAAMKLHKAFIDAAAEPLRANLSLLMDVFGGKQLGQGKDQCLQHLWASLFLVTPVASSTFASVGRMLGDLPPQSLGWLLVDEAGQAVPQSAVGALMRVERAVVVGDPLQIEPVVTMPDGLTPKIFEHFDVNPERFNAAAASVQTLADSAGPFLGRARIGASRGSPARGIAAARNRCSPSRTRWPMRT